MRIVMAIVLSTSKNWNNENENKIAYPIVYVEGATEMFFLIKEISQELEGYINTGNANADELHVLNDEQEQAICGKWIKIGLTVTYRSQKIIYMHRSVTVIYPQISNPTTGIKISLLPWFMLPGRAYPVFTYVYAIWHYHSTGKKSLKETAAATGELFGIKSFNKSTVSRSIKAMEDIVDLAGIDTALPVDEPVLATDEELFKYVPEILNGNTTVEEMKKRYGEEVKSLPAPIKGGGSVRRALSDIPAEYSRVIKESGSVSSGRADKRKRPARPRNKEKRLKQRPIVFIGRAQIKSTRIAFIEICRRLVLNSAVIYHTYLLN